LWRPDTTVHRSRDRDAQHLEDGRIQVHHRYAGVRDPGLVLVRQLDVERNAQRLVVERVAVTEAAVVEELLAVVRGHDDQRAVVETAALQHLEELAEFVGRVADGRVVLIHQAGDVRARHARPKRQVLTAGNRPHVPAVVDELSTRRAAEQRCLVGRGDAVRPVRVHRVQIQEEGASRTVVEPAPHAGQHFVDVGVGRRATEEVVEAVEALVIPGLARHVVVQRHSGGVPAASREHLGQGLELGGESRTGVLDAVPRGEQTGEDRGGARPRP
jgi:hypothetical protein